MRDSLPRPYAVVLPILLLLLLQLCHPPRWTEAQTVHTAKPTNPHHHQHQQHDGDEESEPTVVISKTVTQIVPANTDETPTTTTRPQKVTKKHTVVVVKKDTPATRTTDEDVATTTQTVKPTMPIKMTRLNFTDDIFFTLVHGSDKAKMNITDAERFCIKIGARLNLRAPVTAESHLASIHDPFIMKSLMDWILTKERRQFRIGGEVTKVKHRNRMFFVVRWLDGSRDDFRFFSEADQSFASLALGETVNLAVGYLDGRWIPMLPQRRAYFLCETRINDPDAMLRDSPNFFQHFAHRGRGGRRRE